MAITLIGHQPIDFTYKENAPCENLSEDCLHYELADNPMFQVKNSTGTAPLVVVFDSELNPIIIPVSLYSITNEHYTYTLNFSELGMAAGCYEICVYEVSSSSGTNLVANGLFADNIDGWDSVEGILLEVDTHTEDTVTLIATGGTGPYTYSNGGDTYQMSATITGLTAGETYTFYVKDSNGVISSIIYTLRDCGSFANSYAFDIKDIPAVEIKDCEAFDFT
jgi:hypothetical protein